MPDEPWPKLADPKMSIVVLTSEDTSKMNDAEFRDFLIRTLREQNGANRLQEIYEAQGMPIKIRFRGQGYLLVDGDIATEEQYENFYDSYAHWYPDENAVIRYAYQIGTNADIEFVDETERAEGTSLATRASLRDADWTNHRKSK